MIIGVTFEIQQALSDSLWQILKCIDVEKYCWYNIMSQNEVWKNYDGGESLQDYVYNGTEFKKEIMNIYYIVFLKFQAYFEGDYFYDIHTYNEFKNSDCQIILLISDCENVEVFVKDLLVAESIYKNAVDNDFSNVEYITETSNQRTEMKVI